MRAIRRLERRFNKALENIDAGTVHTDTDAEIVKLSKDIEVLEAWKVEQEKVLDTATADIAAAKKEASDLAEVKAALETKVADLNAGLDTLTKSGEVAQNQLSELAAQKLAAEVALQQAQESLAEASKGNEQMDAISAKLADAEKANADLQTQLAVASGQQSSHAGSTELEKELLALKAQRETDLAEVNVILEKLAPLLEGK